MNKISFTQEGFEKLRREHNELTNIKRQQAITRVQTARNMGDLSENSEYSAAKDDLAFVEGRIRELEELMKHAQIVANGTNHSGIDIGDTIVVEVNGVKDMFQIVGEFEANPLEKKLSTTSPIGKALLGKKIGDTVEVQAPVGKITYKVSEVKKS